MGSYRYVKRFIDILGVVFGLILTWPLFLLAMVMIKLDSSGPIFFKQRRIGKDKVEFLIFKFRTMRIDTPKDIPTHLLENPDVYITRMGRFLRRTSLDEIPQVFNILRGEMSIVGPRPALWNQVDLIAERDKYGANGLVPGLTGWAQINGRDELPIPVKAEYDGYYFRNVSFLLDVKILALTFCNVITAKGIKEGSQN